MAYTASGQFRRPEAARTFVPGRPRRPPGECDDTHRRKSDFDLHPFRGRGLILIAPPRERNLNGPAAADQRRVSTVREGN